MNITTDSDGYLCRKDIYKLLKEDVEDFKNNVGSSGRLGFGSFQLKMAFFRVLDERPTDEFWSRDNIRNAYVFSIGRIIKALEEACIVHYFVSNVNVLKKISCQRKRDLFIRFLKDQKEMYALGLRAASRRN